MKKALFAIIACCLAFCSTFAQFPIEAHLSEDNTQYDKPIEINKDEHGHIFIKINGEPDNQSRTPIQIQLENNSTKYWFLLFNHAWPKKLLRREWKVYLEKGIGDNALSVENINLDPYQDNFIPPLSNNSYTFPDILVEEGKTYECKIPIHLATPKPCLFNKKKKKRVEEIITYTITVSVENKDEAYDKLKHECDSLVAACNEALAHEIFCTNTLHRPSFKVQTEKFTTANQELKDQIRRPLYDNSLPKESKKYQRYKALLDSLDEIDYALEHYRHDCGKHRTPPQHKCSYCNLSLQEIYNKLNRHYQNLYNNEVQRSDIIKEVEALYKCCKDPTCSKHAQQWKKGDKYKSGIIEFYNKIKNYN